MMQLHNEDGDSITSCHNIFFLSRRFILEFANPTSV